MADMAADSAWPADSLVLEPLMMEIPANVGAELDTSFDAFYLPSTMPMNPSVDFLEEQSPAVPFDFPSTADDIATFLDQSLSEDPSFCAPVPDPIRPATPPLKIILGRSREIIERTPVIPPGKPGRRHEQPLYHYWYKNPYDDLPAPRRLFHASTDAIRNVLLPLEFARDERIVQPSLVRQEELELSFEARELGEAHPHSMVNCTEDADALSSAYPTGPILQNPQPCTECAFARVTCHGMPGRPCIRCTKLLYGSRTSKPAPSMSTDRADSRAFVLRVIFFDMKDTQEQLSALRDEAGKLSNLVQGKTLENLFTEPIICHILSSTAPSHHGWTEGVRVVLTHLATTRTANSGASSSKLDFPEPGFNVSQLDSFLVVEPRMKKLKDLSQTEQGTIAAALKIADYLGILFNWDANTVCFEQGAGGCAGVAAKNIVLETMYAMAHRIQDLMKKLLFEVKQSLTGRRDPSHDPATLSCALWIIYSSLNKFHTLSWNAKSLQNLKKFLNTMHERSNNAITQIEHYRREVAFTICGQKSANLQAYKNLVVAKKVPKAAIAFTYERFRPVRSLIGINPTLSYEQSYTDVLEDSVADNQYLYNVPDSFFNQNTFVSSSGARSPLTASSLDIFNKGKRKARSTNSVISTSTQPPPISTLKPAESIPTPSLTRGRTSQDPHSHGPNIQKSTSQSYADTDLSLAAEIHRTRNRLAQLEERQRKSNAKDDILCPQIEAHEDWLSPPPMVGPDLKVERVKLAEKAAKRLKIMQS